MLNCVNHVNPDFSLAYTYHADGAYLTDGSFQRVETPCYKTFRLLCGFKIKFGPLKTS